MSNPADALERVARAYSGAIAAHFGVRLDAESAAIAPDHAHVWIGDLADPKWPPGASNPLLCVCKCGALQRSTLPPADYPENRRRFYAQLKAARANLAKERSTP